MEYLCPVCEKPYDGVFCTACTSSSRDMKDMDEAPTKESETAYLVDLVTNRKIPIVSPICKCGRDESNNIVISGDQSISRCHFIISKEGKQYYVKDENSRHGTFLNGKQLFTLEEVNDGDVLKVGVSLFWFVLEAAGKQTQPSGEDEFSHNFQANAKPVAEAPEKAGIRASIHPGKGSAGQSEEDLSTITSDNIPITVADDSLADKYRFKTHSFEAPNKQSSHLAAPPRSIRTPLEPGAMPNSVSKNDMLDLTKSATASESELPTQLRESAVAPVAQVNEELKGGDLAELSAQPLSADELIRSLDMIPDPVIPDEINKKPDKLAKTIPAKNAQAEASNEQPKGMSGFIGKLGASIGGNKESKPEGKALLGSVLASSSTDKAKSPVHKPVSAVSNTPPETQVPPPPAAPSHAERMPNEASQLDNKDKDEKDDLNLSALQAASELKQLDEHLSDLADQLRFLQQKFEDLSGNVSRLRRIRNTLLAIQTLDGEDLTGSCFKVFAQLGFQVSLIEPEPGKDRQELKLEQGDKTAIVRMVGPLGDGERTQLGQLTMTQARFWLEGKPEPKGILIVSGSGNGASVLANERHCNEDLADYAVKKNVCLMTTGQLLSIYSSMMTNGAQPLPVQTQILQTSGWLSGFGQECSTNSGDKASKVDRMSYLLPA
jgi:FHA domain